MVPPRCSDPESAAGPYTGSTHICEIVFPEDTNPYGKMFGGRALQLMDKAAGVAATRYCHHHVVTASSDRVDFDVPIPQGAIIELISKVVYTGRSSLGVRVDLYTEGPLADQCVLATRGFFTMVAVDTDLRPLVGVVAEFVPKTDEEQADWERARHLRKQQ